MKNLMLTAALALALASCQNTSENTSASETPKTAISDNDAINNLVHDFYKWYGTFSESPAGRLDFVSSEGSHPKLDLVKLEAYYDNFRKTGLVSEDFIKNEIEYYKGCETSWASEAEGDVPSCLDYDRYMCAQDWDTKVYTTTPTSFKIDDPSRVYVSLPLPSGISLGFIARKVQDKWILDSAGCGIDE